MVAANCSADRSKWTVLPGMLTAAATLKRPLAPLTSAAFTIGSKAAFCSPDSTRESSCAAAGVIITSLPGGSAQ